MDIEKEVQARVDFKMNELLTAIENTAKANWNNAFQSGNPKYSNYWEAFNQMKSMFKKEFEMGLPYDEMSELNRRIQRNKSVERIMENFCQRGTRDYYHKERIAMQIIDEAQRW